MTESLTESFDEVVARVLADRSAEPASPLRPLADLDLSGFVSRTSALDADTDPLVVAGENGYVFSHVGGSLAGSTACCRIGLPAGQAPDDVAAAVSAALGAVTSHDGVGAPGCGPIAMGAFPFAGDQAELVIPGIVVGRGEDGTHWLTTLGPPADHDRIHEQVRAALASAATDLGVQHRHAPHSFDVAATIDPDVWCDRVGRARDRLHHGTLHKVVLAREIIVTANGDLSRRSILERLRDAYPGCMLFGIDGFVGASPELLVARHGTRVRSHPLAGTAPRSADPEQDRRLADDLRASTKNREEHRITIDMVHDTLLPYCSYLDEEAEPSIVPMANVQHLGTMVEGHLSSPPPSALELALALHPTPAVGGWPRDEALALITELEGLDRGRYAGPVGWVDAAGNGEWAVGIRSAEIAAGGRSARVFAGVGVVADSDPVAELAETRAKFQAMLSAIVRP